MGANKNRSAARIVLGPLLHNIFINGIFWFANHAKICNYVDDTTVFACHSHLGIVIRKLEDYCSVIVEWFSDKLLKLIDEKCPLMIFGDKNTEMKFKMGSSEIKECDCEKLLGITVEKKLNFKKHIEDLGRMANQKIHALARLSDYIDLVKSEILMNS